MPNPPLIALRGITKAFAGVAANSQIDLDIHAAEIHALLGENGAGKSTLMKILFGFYRADAGEILLNGELLDLRSPREARAAGIGMVFQELNLIPAFSVAENIALFLPDLAAVLDQGAIERRIQAVSERYGLSVNPRAMVSQLSIGEQQKVEILKLLLSDARLLILDEPTRVLAPHEVRALFDTLAGLRKDGFAIVLITHKMKEVLECADRISVLRGGRLAGSILRQQASEDGLVSLMFEKAVADLDRQPQRVADHAAAPVLELQDVASGSRLRGISLKVMPGEILGIAGVSGNGQKELCEVVLGMEPCTQGRKHLHGHDVTADPIWEMRRNGVSFIPENPLTMAAAPFMTVLENLALTNVRRYSRNGGFRIDWQAVRADGQATAERLGFPVAFDALARSLSGGNLQRMIIVREMSHEPRLVIASYLTRGLDVQSAVAARQALIQARLGGAGVLLVSEDLDELFALSDRLLVLFSGQIVGEFRPAETNAFEVGRLMTGSKVERAQSH
jgi:simple sugar transport system ATP-binding protein